MTDRINLTMTKEDASYLEDSIAYYLSAAQDNYGGGYTPGSEYDDIEREQFDATQKIANRLRGMLEKRES